MYSLKHARYHFNNLLSRKIIFKNIFKLKEFYWVYIATNYYAKGVGEGGMTFDRKIELIVEAADIRSLSNLGTESKKKTYKVFVFDVEEFCEKCSSFLETNSINPFQHFYIFTL